VLAHWVEQNVLRSDLAGSECLCVAQRKLEHPRLSASTESDLRDLHADTDGDDPHDLRTDALRRMSSASSTSAATAFCSTSKPSRMCSVPI
jgi:hypothetical protein